MIETENMKDGVKRSLCHLTLAFVDFGNLNPAVVRGKGGHGETTFR
jgi:hypothetical protein